MKFDVLTLFPDMFNVLKESIIGRATRNKQIEIRITNIRDFSKDKHKKVDDTPYGGGAGMVLKPDVVYDAYVSIPKEKSAKVIYLSPQGKTLNQAKVEELAKEEHLILLCGHYEGIDQRVIDTIVDEEISIGDYVLTGGELPAIQDQKYLWKKKFQRCYFLDTMLIFVNGERKNHYSIPIKKDLNYYKTENYQKKKS